MLFSAVQMADLGSPRLKAPDNAAGHVRRDRDLLPAELAAIDHSRSSVVGVGVAAEGGETVMVVVEIRGVLAGIGVREDAAIVDTFVEAAGKS